LFSCPSIATWLTVLGLVVGFSAATVSAENSDEEINSSRFSELLARVQEQRSGSVDAQKSQTPACPENQWRSGEYSLDRGGILRPFRVHVPAGYDPQSPGPLIVAFHGWGGNNAEFLQHASVTRELDERGYILLAPVGLGPEEGNGFPASCSFSGSTTGLDGDGVNPQATGATEAICNDARTTDYTYPSCSGVAENGCSWTQCTDDDVAFAVALVAAARKNLCVDSARVYAVGGSNGGMFAWDLGRNEGSAGIFRAIAPIIGLPHRGFLEPPTRTGGMPVLLITGTRDRTVPPGTWGDLGFTTTSDGDFFHYTGGSAITRVWANAHGCDVTVAPRPVDVGLSNVDCRGWERCSGGSPWPPVLDCRSDMGHIYGLNWSWSLIMDFFDQHR